ncbi:MAG: hypothetical protein ACOYWZ_07090 [Bacillota bacterium]
MLKNNLLAFLAHFITVIAGILDSLVISDNYFSRLVSLTFMLISSIFYLFIGSRFNTRNSIIKNYFSFSLVTVIGLVIWILDFNAYNVLINKPIEGGFLKGVT